MLTDGKCGDRRQKSSKSPRFLSNQADSGSTQMEETGGLCGVAEAELPVWTSLVRDKHEASKCRYQVGSLKLKGDMRTDVNVVEFSTHESLGNFKTNVARGEQREPETRGQALSFTDSHWMFLYELVPTRNILHTP